MKTRIKIAKHPSVVRTATRFALIVGPILVMINHGDSIITGEMTTIDWLKSALTMLVPYTVSTLSSISTYMSCQSNTD